MKRRAFTLIELLLVILMIALLIALLVPGIAEAMRQAKRAQCNDHLNTIGKALQSFSAEHSGAWPQRSDSAGSPYEWDDAWYDQLFTKYLVNPKVLYCPDNSEGLAPPGGSWQKSWSGSQRRISYTILDGRPAPSAGAVDQVYGRIIGNAEQAGGWNINDVAGEPQGFRGARPVKTWAYVGSSWQWANTIEYPIFRPAWSGMAEGQNLPVMCDLILERPNQAWIVNHGTLQSNDPLGMNILYADGHASWKTAATASGTADDRNQQPLWRRIWKQSAGQYVRMIVNPTDTQLPLKTVKD